MDSVNPWIRANLEQFTPETLELIPQGQQQEYITVMKELSHARGIAALALEQMFQKEQARAAFFEPFINEKSLPKMAQSDCTSVEEVLISNLDTPDYNTKARLAEAEAGAVTPNYTPVTDLNEYRGRHE